ncbi:MAG: recombinase family protein, partial [Actinomycetota bacterium]
LDRGEQKSLQTDRVILVPGPEEEAETVRWIYRRFVNDGAAEGQIASELNERGIKTDLGRDWNRGTVRQVLTNEKYVGNNVYNRTSFKLKRKHVRNAEEIWVRKDGAFQAIVSHELFFTAHGVFQERQRRHSDEELLAMLRRLASECETLSAAAIDRSDSLPTAATYRSRFGSLIEAYRRVGYEPERDYGYIEINRQLRERWPGMVQDVSRRLKGVGASVSEDARSGYLMIKGEYSAAVVLSRCQATRSGSFRWRARLNSAVAPDITILARMNEANATPADYYLLPIMDLPAPRLLLCEENGAYLDTYQFDNLDFFASLASRSPLSTAA